MGRPKGHVIAERLLFVPSMEARAGWKYARTPAESRRATKFAAWLRGVRGFLTGMRIDTPADTEAIDQERVA
jgi:hypothetical protein